MLLFMRILSFSFSLSPENLVGEQFYCLLVFGRLRTYRLVGWFGYESVKYPYERLG